MVSVVLTDHAAGLLARVRAERHGELTMVIGNGCCDSTAPFLFETYLGGPNEIEVGRIAGDVRVLLDAPLVPLFEGREAVIDAAPGVDGDSFSCESELGERFTLARLPAAVQSS
jgi:uncharacterized protein (DUF779 family)